VPPLPKLSVTWGDGCSGGPAPSAMSASAKRVSAGPAGPATGLMPEKIAFPRASGGKSPVGATAHRHRRPSSRVITATGPFDRAATLAKTSERAQEFAVRFAPWPMPGMNLMALSWKTVGSTAHAVQRRPGLCSPTRTRARVYSPACERAGAP
jgi:hypothetical protein